MSIPTRAEIRLILATQRDKQKLSSASENELKTIVSDTAFKWFLENTQATASLTRGSSVFERISRQVHDILGPLKATGFRPIDARVKMNWELVKFLEAQEYKTRLDQALERAITITGSPQNAQALTTTEYMRQTWPSSGFETISMVKSALRSPQKCSICKRSDSKTHKWS